MTVMLCIFIHRYRWGVQIRGDERGFYEKARIYRRKGIKLIVIEKQPSMKDSLDPDTYESLTMRSGHLPLRNIFDLALILYNAFMLMLKIKKRPDLVYVYNQDPENVIVGYLAKLFFSVPTIIVYHHISPSNFETLRQGVVRRRMSRQSIPSSIWRSIIPSLNLFCSRRADIHLALSYATAEEVRRYIGIKDCAVVGNGVDTATFRNLGLERTIDAIFLGRIAHQKGIDVLLSAWAEVIKHVQGAKLIIVGGGDSMPVKRFRDIAVSLGLQGHVIFTGFVNDEELVLLLNRAKLFVFPSRKEGFAQAVSQAMACGLCCILSDIPSLREVYGDAAAYFPTEDHITLAFLILEYLQNDSLRLQKAAIAERLVRDMKWENVVEKEVFQIHTGVKKRVTN